MEHRRDVPGGDIRSCTACGPLRGLESASGSQGVWTIAGDDTEDAAVPNAARLPAAAANQATQTGQWLGVNDAVLEDDKQRPAKQRHTAKRIFEP
jgi:hypothetical protein